MDGGGKGSKKRNNQEQQQQGGVRITVDLRRGEGTSRSQELADV